MGAVSWIVVWAVIAVLAAIACGVIASRKNRNASTWAAWGFIFPPALIALLLLSRYRGLVYRHATLDDEDREAEAN